MPLSLTTRQARGTRLRAQQINPGHRAAGGGATVAENHAQGLLGRLQELPVGVVCPLDVEAMRSQQLWADFAPSGQFEEGPHVPILGPAHEFDRVVPASLFVLRIITPWAIRPAGRG